MPNQKLPTEDVVNWVHLQLRKWCHDTNNALFIAKGYLEELIEDSNDKVESASGGDTAESLAAMARAMARLEDQVLKMRHFAKDEIYDHAGVAKPM